MYSSLRQIKQALAEGETSCVDLVDHYLERIESLNHLNAFVEVFTDSAKKQAIEIDEKIKNGIAGKLAGMVIGIKDLISYKGHKVAASSKILTGFEAIFNSTVVERLLAEDAIILGRLNCDEFAMGASNETSHFGPVLNHADTSKVSGGSSGGSAVAVQA
jgi:aspartyl-tRNA(Asn)/glutamyl-tRNA(Gln) amidotransferase subunit A